jgi:hypothetical protein
MAIFHMQINTVSRSSGRNAPASAAYRAGERIRDERTGAVYDHRNRRDVLHKEILLPSRLEPHGAALDWARERSSLWNAAERIETRHDSRVAREYMVALPAELPAAQRIALARAFSREIADRYTIAVDLAVHAPRPFGDQRNFHAHLLTSTREVAPDGLGPKAGLDMQGTTRAELGLPTSRKEFIALRERWADLVNEHLRAAHLEARVDSRSLEAQGIDREPRPRLPYAAIASERRGERSEVADRIRERYRARVAARAERADASHLTALPATAPPLSAPAAQAAAASGSEQRQQQAVRDWLQYRQARGRAVGTDAPSGELSPTETVRRQAIEAWRAERAKGAEPHAPPGEPQRSIESESGAGGDACGAGRDRDLAW